MLMVPGRLRQKFLFVSSNQIIGKCKGGKKKEVSLIPLDQRREGFTLPISHLNWEGDMYVVEYQFDLILVTHMQFFKVQL